MFSIIIPTLNNLEYLKFCINSILKNSEFNNEILYMSLKTLINQLGNI